MRLIDADALLDTLQELFDKREREAKFTGDRNVMATWNDAIYHIKTAPTIEPEKGRWIDKSNGIEGAWNYCSVCGEQAIDLYDFCPNCGASMRGGEVNG